MAIDPSTEQQTALRTLQQRLGGVLEGVSWTAPAALHLTLKFLGEQEEKRLPAIAESLRQAVLPAAPFNLQFKGLGVFPSPRRARIIWAGIAAGRDELASLAHSLEEALAETGFPRESRPFKAHLTLGRVRRPLSEQLLRDLLAGESSFSTAESAVQSLRLYRSRLSPRGAQYSALQEFFLSDRGKLRESKN